MKNNLHSIINKKMSKHDKLYGTATMGERGQIVIPADARKDLGLKPGDQFLVLGKLGKALGLVKTDQLGELIENIMKNLAGSGMEKEVRQYVLKFFGKDFLKS